MNTRPTLTGRRRVLAAAAAIASLVSVSACGGGSSDSSSSAPIKVGTVVPLTGPAAAIAGQYLAGVEAAIDKVNASGGVNGRKIQLTKVDDGFQIPRSIAGIRELSTKDKVVGIVGPYGTNAAVAVRPVAEQLKVPLIGPLAYTDGFFKPTSPYTFALWPSQGSMFNAVTEYAATKLNLKKFAIVAQLGEVGDSTVEGTNKALAAHGLKTVKVIRVQNAAPDYSGSMAQAKSAGADALIINGDNASMAKMVSDAKRVGLDVPSFGSVSAGDSGFAKLAGDQGEGTYGVTTIDLSGKAPGWSAYLAAMKKYTKTDPNSTYAASGYAAGQTLIGALDKIKGDVTTPALIKSLDSNSIETLAGAVAFSKSNHLGRSQLYLTQVKSSAITMTGDLVGSK